MSTLVGEEGIEPSLLAEHDFESCADTSSATRPSESNAIALTDRMASAIVLYLWHRL